MTFLVPIDFVLLCPSAPMHTNKSKHTDSGTWPTPHQLHNNNVQNPEFPRTKKSTTDAPSPRLQSPHPLRPTPPPHPPPPNRQAPLLHPPLPNARPLPKTHHR